MRCSAAENELRAPPELASGISASSSSPLSAAISTPWLASDSGSPRSISSIITPMRSITASTASTRRRSGVRRSARTSASASSAAWLSASSRGKSKKPQLPLTVWTKRKIVSSRARSDGSDSQATISPASAASISRVSATNSASRSSIAPRPQNRSDGYGGNVVKRPLRITPQSYPREISVSCSVMNSTSAGRPASIAASARRSAGTTSAASVTRSPWHPSERANAA